MDRVTKPRGRPALDPSSRRSMNLTFRTRGGLRQNLKDAADASGRSISEEIEARLMASFPNSRATDEVMIKDEPKTLSVPDAGLIYFGMDRHASYRAARSGIIPTIKISDRMMRVPVRALERMLDEAGTTPKSKD